MITKSYGVLSRGQPQVQEEKTVYSSIRELLNAVKMLISLDDWGIKPQKITYEMWRAQKELLEKMLLEEEIAKRCSRDNFLKKAKSILPSSKERQHDK